MATGAGFVLTSTDGNAWTRREAMNNAFLYCLIEAALRFDIRLLLAQMMSNHHHVVLHDPGGHVVELETSAPLTA